MYFLGDFSRKSDVIGYFCLRIWIQRAKNYRKQLFFPRLQKKVKFCRPVIYQH